MCPLQEAVYGDPDHIGAYERSDPMSELRKQEGDASADGVHRKDLAEELTPKTGRRERAVLKEGGHGED